MIERIARRYQSRWLQGYARGKLRSDPAFEAAFEAIRDTHLPVLDIGCGIGLFPLFLREKGFRELIVGIDLDEKKIAHAQRAASGEPGIHLLVQDAAATHEFVGNAVLLDVLHYIDRQQQLDLLERVAEQIAPGGVCVIRDTLRDGSWRFRATQLEELFMRAVSWMKSGVQHYPTLEEITAPFRRRGFAEEARPLWGRTPFNSYLFVFRRPRA